MRPQVELWYRGVSYLAKISKKHPNMYYTRMRMSIHLEYQYLQRKVTEADKIMGPI